MASTSPDSTPLRLAFVAAAIVAAATLVTAGGSAVGLAHTPSTARAAVAEAQPPVRAGVEPDVVGATGGKDLADRTVADANADRTVADGNADISAMRSGSRHDASSGWCAPCHDPFRVGTVGGHGGTGKTRAAGAASAHRTSPTGTRRGAQVGGGKTASSSPDQSTSSVEPPAS